MRRLFVSFARIGDLVLLAPTLATLARDAELHLLSRPWAREVLADQPTLAGIHTLVHPNHGAWSEWWRGRPRERLGRHLAGIGFDEVVCLDGERPLITGWLDRHLPGARRRRLTAGPPGCYVPEGMAQGLAESGFDTAGHVPVPRLHVPDHRRRALADRLAALGRRVVAVQAGSSLTHRRWRPRPNLKSLSQSQWSAVVSGLLHDDLADAVVLVGSRFEHRDATAIRAGITGPARHRVHVWTQEAPLVEQAALAAGLHGMISVDTGPAHIAAAVDCPLLVLFGPSDPVRWAPRSQGPVEILVGEASCRPCLETPAFKRCRANVCLTGLEPAQVLDAWRRLQLRRGLPNEPTTGYTPVHA
jgi:ADP-heptose:LPS heptosyltransferase